MRTYARAAVPLALAGATLLATPCAAQNRREPIRGSAELADGAPWPGAKIQLLSRPLALDERLGTADELTIQADSNGRFTAQLLVGRTYLAWAVETLEGVRYRVSHPVEEVLAGRPLTLTLNTERARRKLTFKGLDAWRARGRVIARVLTATVPSVVVETTLSGDEWLLPPLPSRSSHLELLCDGVPLQQWPRPVDLGVATARTINIPRGRRVKVRVQAADQPVANAALALRTIDPGRGARIHNAPLGHTNAAGTATVVLPISPDREFAWHNYAFGVEANGFAPLANISTVRVAKDHDPDGPAPAVTVELTAGTHHHLTLRCANTAFDAPVAIAKRTSSSGGNFVSYGDWSTITRPTDTGKLTIRRQPDDSVLLLAATADLSPAPSTQSRPAPLHPIALLGKIAANEANQELTWQLDGLRRLPCRVDLDGVPMPHARLAVLIPGRERLRRALTNIVTDRTGRIAVLVPPKLPLTLVTWNDLGFAIASNVTAQGSEVLQLTMHPIGTLPGRVRNRNGEPLVAANVQYHVHAKATADEPLARAIQLLSRRTDATGKFMLPMFPNLEYSLRAVVTPGDEHYLEAPDFIAGQDQPPQIELQLGNGR